MVNPAARLDALKARLDEIDTELSSPLLQRDGARFRTMGRERSRLQRIVDEIHELSRLEDRLREARALLSDGDPEMAALAAEEVAQVEPRVEAVAASVVRGLLPPDPHQDKDAILEIRAGTGGEEAALFAADLLRMYLRYAERKGWRTERISTSPTELGGVREVICSVQGAEAYGLLRYESGVHRVQRVPATEASGRIHTSAVSVAVLPEAEDVDVEIDPKELRIDVFRSSGPGGQSVNTTDSAVRVTHLPSGIMVQCQDEKSQHKNKAKALKVLRSRLLDLAIRERDEELARQRRSQVGTGDRSAKIRTYNFPQSRVTDHRIGLTLYRLDEVLDGALDPFTQGLQQHHTEAQLAGLEGVGGDVARGD
ncbi:MAG: peptide chain release factor 1 [Candidatus Eisenbacteria bacterium]|jgi:peptide chain release factor 1|nr:peptide chain release factor 1 [Candidatus Eisenbacteria bacterium]